MGLALLGGAPLALAQEPEPQAGGTNCAACHENLYYLHDTGKWHCLCDATPTCVHCHGGQPEAVEAGLAHEGMVVNPLQENAATCRQCHCADCQQHVNEFIAVAGGTVTEGRGQVYPASPPKSVSASITHAAYHLPARLQQPWRLAAVGGAAAGLIALSVYGFCCWRTDRRPARPR
jgi:hypothetical protein